MVLNLQMLVSVMLYKIFALYMSDPVYFYFRYLCPNVAHSCIS